MNNQEGFPLFIALFASAAIVGVFIIIAAVLGAVLKF